MHPYGSSMSLMELQDKSERVYISTGIRRQTSAEIVSEARRSLRTLATQRPFTPQEKHRQLFEESSSRAHDGQPPSAFSLHARHFEAPDSRPGSGTRLSPLEHKPSLSVSLDEDGGVEEATLPKPPAERGNTRIGSGGSRARLLRAASINRLPPMTPNTKNMSLEARIGADQPGDGEKLHCADVTEHETKSSSETDLHILIKHRIPQTDVSSERGSKPEVKLGHGDTGDDNMDESVFWNTKVFPVLQEFESFAQGDAMSDEIVGELCNACNGLYNTLAERGMLGRQCKKRSAILRTLFRLIDVGSDRLNLTLAKLILALNVTGNNLLNICKLVFKISRKASNDTLFLNGCILDSLLSLLHCEDVWSKGEAVLYCVGSLKLLSGNAALSRLLLSKGFIGVLLQLSKRLMHGPSTSANVTSHKSEGEGQHIIAGHILVQVTAALRNIADQSESRLSFLSNKAFSTLCLILENHRSDIDICINVARIFSKLSTYTECCHALAETPHCCSLFLDLLGKYSRKQDLVVRLLFTLGNLTAKSPEARERVYEEEGVIDVLLDLFQVYQETPSPPEQFRAPEREDVLVKLIRLLANLAIHPTVGTALAANTLCVQLLLEVLECRCVQESEELVVNAVATINNLSFYQGMSSVVRAQHTHISQLLLKLLLSSSMDAVLEATCVFGNLSQIKDVRHFIMQHKVEQYVVTLLDSKTPDVCFSACGVLINLSADPDNRAMLRAEGTVQKLIDCLCDFGPQDWHLATVVCQTLWNCSLDGELQHAEELLEILWLYTDRGALQWPSDDGVRQVQEACWELLFLPVAERLRQRFHIEDTTGIIP
ncbi:armadillo repeat-containing protein 2-like isoform X2 [Sinocyclocheilus rhinocerous]|uniref:armadillo repeat-containing protein 2-like isoform X1 n=1 Tax=Sinocyclocheilus rhinocerous TaxID=307959 RepID=UPI0007BA8286|nr:PREDICTED: armadillo repeat-containing protein 2-like isoform X1 [Sinocyclocheilus rhinocerous]XP_016391472.1 PREDICTED: armadillo repeat-containing protein 2-like isoform X2 [Sinocyclocheilus rhinocerous]